MSVSGTRVDGATRARVRRPALPLAGWLAVTLGAFALMAVEYPPGAWFDALAKPGPFLPESTLNAISAALLAFCAVAAWRVDGTRVPKRPYALRLFLAQLALGIGWMALLLGGQLLGPAVAVAAVMWLALVATVVAFSRLDRIAGVLMIPQLAWVTFGFQQCVALWTLN